jgi:hypothetical protein
MDKKDANVPGARTLVPMRSRVSIVGPFQNIRGRFDPESGLNEAVTEIN